jgi:hypothetical protein
MNMVMQVFLRITPMFEHSDTADTIISIYIISSINAIAYTIYAFIDFTRPIDENDPLNRKDLYKVSGTWNRIKKLIFRGCFIINNILVPFAALFAFIYVMMQ